MACGYDVRLFALQEITPSTTDDTAKDSPLENACYDVTVIADVTLGVVIQSLSVSHNYLAAMSGVESGHSRFEEARMYIRTYVFICLSYVVFIT